MYVTHMYIYVHTDKYIQLYVYIYIERERDGHVVGFDRPPGHLDPTYGQFRGPSDCCVGGGITASCCGLNFFTVPVFYIDVRGRSALCSLAAHSRTW